MRKGSSEPLADALKAEIAALEAMPDSTIDTSDAPPVTDWSGARRGMFYRPIKKQLTVRFDADVLDWFRHHGGDERGYQTRMNRVLREYMMSHTSE